MKVYTSAQSRTGISAVLTVMSGLGTFALKMMTYVWFTVHYLSFMLYNVYVIMIMDYGYVSTGYSC